MKPKKIFACAFVIFAVMLAGNSAHAQQIKNSATTGFNSQLQSNNAAANYTYKIFQAPNKMYGYNILCNGKYIFHQGASPVQSGEFVTALSQKEQAEKAALLSIEKIKKNSPAALTRQELKNITLNKKQSQ